MAKIVNVVASCSNTGKTVLIEGLIKELKNRGYTVATIKHDVHGFDIDKEGKDTWRHRKAGAEAVIISSKERMALIREVQEEVPLEELIKQVEDFDFIIIEGYKKIIHKDGKIYGAIIQGDLSYAGVLTQLIKEKIHVSKVKKPLFEIDYADFFNIKENLEYTY